MFVPEEAARTGQIKLDETGLEEVGLGRARIEFELPVSSLESSRVRLFRDSKF